MYSTSNGAYGSWNQSSPFGSQPSTSYNKNQIVAQYQPSNSYQQLSNSYQQPYYQPKSQNPQFMGLTNLGNTCYMTSVLQAIFDVLVLHSQSSYNQPITYLYSQLQKTHDTKDYSEFKRYLGSKLEFAAGFQQQDAH